MRPLRLAILLTALATAGVAPVHGRNVPSLFEPANRAPGTLLEERLLADAADGRLDEHSLLEAALVASGAKHAQDLLPYRRQLDAWIDELHGQGLLGGKPRRRAQVVFEFMHRRILRGGYDVNCTDLRLAFDQGRFNCVSATVLYHCLAEESALEVCGLEVPGHAMTRLFLPEGPFDVETTCPSWFRLKDDAQQQAELAKRTTGPAGVRDRAAAREVLPVGMTAMIYYNRGVDLLAEQRFAEAAAANAKALRLDPTNATARGNLLATLNNWAIALGNSGRYAQAGDLLFEGLVLDPTYETFAPNYLHVYRRWAHGLFDRQEPDRAFAVFDVARRHRSMCRDVWRAELTEVNAYGMRLLERGQFEEAVLLFDRAIGRQPGEKALQDHRRCAYRQWVSALNAAGRRDEADRIARRALAAR